MQNQSPVPPVPPVLVHTLEVMPVQLRYWCVLHALQGAVMGVLLLLLFALALEGFDSPVWATVVLAPVVALLPAMLGWFFAKQRFARYHGQWVAGEGIVLHSGVWWRNEAWVPMTRLQHLDVSQGPLDRSWGMASLTLHTAGSHDHKTRIDGLPLAQAHALREALLPRVRVTHE